MLDAYTRFFSNHLLPRYLLIRAEVNLKERHAFFQRRTNQRIPVGSISPHRYLDITIDSASQTDQNAYEETTMKRRTLNQTKSNRGTNAAR